jgi:hypothetical protein
MSAAVQQGPSSWAPTNSTGTNVAWSQNPQVDVNTSWAAPLHNSTTNYHNGNGTYVQSPGPVNANTEQSNWQSQNVPPPPYGTPPQFPNLTHNTINGLEHQRQQQYQSRNAYGYGSGNMGGSQSPMNGQSYQGGNYPQQNYRGLKLESIKLTQFSGEDISKFFAFKQDFIAYIHSQEHMPVEEKNGSPPSSHRRGSCGRSHRTSEQK